MQSLQYAVDAHALKLQRLHNRLLRGIGKFDGSTEVREMHMAFKIRNVYDYVIKLCTKHIDVIPNHRNKTYVKQNKNKPGI
jgi:hypothetical protein